MFTKIDANSGFWQEKLAENSQLLTTFLTSFGRYYFKRLPFGLQSAPERFQKRMINELEGLEGAICIMDDILVHGKRQTEEHDDRLKAVLTRLIRARITLNLRQVRIFKKQLKFAGHSLSAQGISPDPDKTAAIEKIDTPQNVRELRRFLGMTTTEQQNNRSSSKTCPRRQCLFAIFKIEWHWGQAQEESFSRLKKEMTQAPVLAHYCSEKETIIISADASSYGLGTVLSQVQDDDSKKPIAYASHSMTSTEQRYAQIEKEALATTWACEKFADFVLGKEFLI